MNADLFLIMVEGSHDAAFVRRMLLHAGFERVSRRGELPATLRRLIPPIASVDQLFNLPLYPDFYRRTRPSAQWVTTIVCHGVERLVREFESSLDNISVADLKGAAIICDADDLGAQPRFDRVRRELSSLNRKRTRVGDTGFPLDLPSAAGVITSGAPRIGVYVLPDNLHHGTLDTLMCSCSERLYPDFYAPARALVQRVDAAAPGDSADLANLRRGSGRDKATAGIIGNLLYPGASLTTAIDRGRWFDSPADAERGLLQINAFLSHLLA